MNDNWSKCSIKNKINNGANKLCLFPSLSPVIGNSHREINTIMLYIYILDRSFKIDVVWLTVAAFYPHYVTVITEPQTTHLHMHNECMIIIELN